jgi:citrate lyase subunit gamma (acyl carrier protein)
MEQFSQIGQAGTLESNDILITVAITEKSQGVEIALASPVEKQFGRQIRTVITAVLNSMGIEGAKVSADDRGALDCTIRARVEAAAARALGQGGHND